jgi:hypothetical protein
MLSNSSKKAMPARKPAAAGIQAAELPCSPAISIEGIKSDHTDAATITPEAKPSISFCKRGEIASFSKKTIAEPATVPAKGIINPNAISIATSFFLLYDSTAKTSSISSDNLPLQIQIYDKKNGKAKQMPDFLVFIPIFTSHHTTVPSIS